MQENKVFISLGKRIALVLALPMLLVDKLRRKGALRQSVRTAMSIFHREGFSGVRRKLFSLAAEKSYAGGVNKNGGTYLQWLRHYDTIGEKFRNELKNSLENFKSKPLISVVMPVYNPNPEWLIEAIESVRIQIYENWELCIADDCSTDPAIRPILEEYAACDDRIKVIFREENGHISAASNSALAVATGEWVALLDHDDLLPETALFWNIDTINRFPDVAMIYSDEDKVDGGGAREAPYFKCDWNMDLFYSQNVFCHLGVYRRDVIDEVGAFRLGFEGAQDYDLALRCVERVRIDQIRHIPRILYHWRIHENSTSLSAGSKPYAADAGARALNDHFSRMGENATAAVDTFGYRVTRPLPQTPPLVTLIIPTRNAHELVRICVESILSKTTYPNYEILLIDNGSDEAESLQYFEEISDHTRINVIRDDSPFNYSALNNAAVKLANGELVGLINNDVEVISPDWLSEMVSNAIRPEIGAVGARLWYPNNTLQHGGIVIGLGGVAGHSHKYLPRGATGYCNRAQLVSQFSAVTGACLLVQKEIFLEAGGLNEADLGIAFNDVDFCLKILELGYKNLWTPYAELYHHESISRGQEDTVEKKLRFQSEVEYMKKSWGDKLTVDPAYSPNLTQDYEDFSLAWPPRLRENRVCGKLLSSANSDVEPASLAVVVHAFYMEVFEELLVALERINCEFTLYVTTPYKWEREVSRLLAGTTYQHFVIPVENRGRDVLPLLKVLPTLVDLGHDIVLKLHTKRSTLRSDGDDWRKDVVDRLLPVDSFGEMIEKILCEPDIGMIGPVGHVVPMSRYWGGNREATLELGARMQIDSADVSAGAFVAGTMFFARISALKPLMDLRLDDKDFEEEKGQTDGTLAHAVERAFAVSIMASGMRLVDTNELLDRTSTRLNNNYTYTDG